VPRKPTLSPTKISNFLACPHKYYWTYVDPKGRWYLRAKSYYSFGSTLHKILQRFHDSSDNGVESTHQALAAYEDGWIEAGFSSYEEMQDAFGEGKQILERYVEESLQDQQPNKVFMVEKQLRKAFGEDFDLIGRLDRVDEHPDGTLEIIDYKSGRQSVSEEDVASDLAMSIYQLLLKDKFPDRPVKATILALRSGIRASYSLSGDELAELEEDLLHLGRIILGSNWEERRPSPKPLCQYCDFGPLCGKDPEFGAGLTALMQPDFGVLQEPQGRLL
jgi:RecB family exonuclease